MSLDVGSGRKLIETARKKERDDRIFTQWAAQLPVMAVSGGYMSYEEYHDRMTGDNIDRRSTKDILAELDEVEKLFEGGSADGDGDI